MAEIRTFHGRTFLSVTTSRELRPDVDHDVACLQRSLDALVAATAAPEAAPTTKGRRRTGTPAARS